MKLKGSISIFFVFALTLIISIICSITELARINCQKLYLQIATNSGLDSMLSLYHRKLYEYYSLYGVEYRTKDLLVDEYIDYIMPYFYDEERNIVVNNWYVGNISKERVNLKLELLTEENYFEKEIIDYMKYNLMGKSIEFLGKKFDIVEEKDLGKLVDTATQIYSETTKSSLYSEIYHRYFNFADAITELENYSKKIEKGIDDANDKIKKCYAITDTGSLSNGENILNKLEKASNEINNLKSYLDFYKSKMNDFRNKVNKSKNLYENDRKNGIYEFNEEIIEFIESEFEKFISFVDENSEMNRTIENKIEELSNIQITMYNFITNVNYYIDLIENIDEEIKDEERSEEIDVDFLDDLNDERKAILSEFSDYIKEMREEIKEIEIESIYLDVSTTNHSDERNKIDKIINLKNGLLLNMVLDNSQISKISNIEENYNSFNIMSKNNGININKILLTEYEIEKFNYYNKNLNNEITKSGSTSLEVERLLYGRFSDIENLKKVVHSILVIRIAMNVLHIYKNSEKREAVKAFCRILFTGFSEIMVHVMYIVMITAWGTAQSVIDVKNLLNNKKVNFMHNDESWDVDVKNIFNFDSINYEEEDTNGLSYKDYLKLLLLKEDQSNINARMVSIMEKNIMKFDNNFRFDNLIFSINASLDFHCKNIFTNVLFVVAKDVKLFDKYSIKINGYKNYSY